nr:MAG TPA: hypothetical protein [Caudoviricetes sp.]
MLISFTVPFPKIISVLLPLLIINLLKVISPFVLKEPVAGLILILLK